MAEIPVTLTEAEREALSLCRCEHSIHRHSHYGGCDDMDGNFSACFCANSPATAQEAAVERILADRLAEHDAAVARQAVDAALAEVEQAINAPLVSRGHDMTSNQRAGYYAAAKIVREARACSTVRDPSEQAGGEQ